jgi:hypothetical protein
MVYSTTIPSITSGPGSIYYSCVSTCQSHTTRDADLYYVFHHPATVAESVIHIHKSHLR